MFSEFRASTLYKELGFGAGRDGRPLSMLDYKPFVNLDQGDYTAYWTDAKPFSSSYGPIRAYRFSFGSQGIAYNEINPPLYGKQDLQSASWEYYAWAVRDGDIVSVPEPATMFLLGSGIVGLAGFRRKFRE